ncbi:DNA-binding transcriptional regulator GbsR (MarR family) [Alkalihalobacillus xiaoxiensis]|uniref:HTH-type transcriptional regulator n=1 Tax=Shouchella xiaoxiensis TaxID=766895 RepID=A0ABS2SW19_9BACI|nr:GbsR/MarR family transcriptional regulator [Shouchella xiaoxiensis]MBM7838995.1 DNA-binding transcriptional regulator GbsR (MarR family) [Shouchella xiaoxiensis]
METEKEMSSEKYKLQRIREQFIHELSTNLHLYGMNESTGRLYGSLLFNDQAMTLDDMSMQLGMSKTSMSTSIRQLTEANMARKVWQKGVRKDLYTSENDWYESFVAIFTKQWRQAVESNRKASIELEQQLTELRRESPELLEEIEIDLKKVDHANGYYDWIESFVEHLESGKIFEYLPKK